MKKLFFILGLLLLCISGSLFAQTDTSGIGAGVQQTSALIAFFKSVAVGYVANFLVYVSTILLLTGLTNKWLKLVEWLKQRLSWIISGIVGMLAFLLKLGLFAELTWYESLLVALLGALAANGVFDTPLIRQILTALKLNDKVPFDNK